MCIRDRSEVIKPDDYVICADRGCNFAKQAGITPNLVVGDFDQEFQQLYHRNPSDLDMCECMDVSLEEIKRIKFWLQDTKSIDDCYKSADILQFFSLGNHDFSIPSSFTIIFPRRGRFLFPQKALSARAKEALCRPLPGSMVRQWLILSHYRECFNPKIFLSGFSVDKLTVFAYYRQKMQRESSAPLHPDCKSALTRRVHPVRT